MRAVALGSSSAGNSFVLEFDMGDGRKPVSLMVECGFSYQTILKKLTTCGIQISNIDACLVTHSHNDHCAAAKDLAKRGIPIFATAGTIDAIGIKGIGHELEYRTPKAIVPGLAVMPFEVEHDAPDSAGFIIKTATETVLFAIDAKDWKDDVTAIAPDFLFIEANFDPTLMKQEQFSLQRHGSLKDMQRYKLNCRIQATHMSIDKTLSIISKLNKKRMKHIFLTHLSDRMSAPSHWKQQVVAISGVPCRVCRKDIGIE